MAQTGMERQLDRRIDMHFPYLYKLTQKSTGKWYVGSRTAKKCHPDEGYICSSRHVKPIYLQNPLDWNREILVIGPAEYIRELETNYLKSLNAKHDPMSFNLHDGDGKFTTAGKKLTSKDVSYLFTPENRLKRSKGSKTAWAAGLYANRKKLFGDANPSKRLDVREKISKALTGKEGGRMTGKVHSPETKAKMAESRRLYWATRKESV
jgi:hypothetical protein